MTIQKELESYIIMLKTKCSLEFDYGRSVIYHDTIERLTKILEGHSEVKRHKIIAVDFDNTLVTDKYPHIGEPIIETIEALQKEIKNGAEVILWTCRRGQQLDEAVAWCERHDIPLAEVNENLPRMIDFYGGSTRKIFANEYWDDRAVPMGNVQPQFRT